MSIQKRILEAFNKGNKNVYSIVKESNEEIDFNGMEHWFKNYLICQISGYYNMHSKDAINFVGCNEKTYRYIQENYTELYSKYNGDAIIKEEQRIKRECQLAFQYYDEYKNAVDWDTVNKILKDEGY